MCDLFTSEEKPELASYTDDNIPAVCESTPENIVSSLESCYGSLFE